MAVNSVNLFNSTSIHQNNSIQTKQKQLIFSSKKNCFKKSLNLFSNPLMNENNNNYYLNNNNNNKEISNGPKGDSKQLIECNELKVKSNKFKSDLLESLDITSNSDSVHMNFSSPGMKDVPQWLKVLRLHKYANLFSNLTYEQLLNTTEEELERKNVTKGARHKLILSIEKLRNRPKILKALEKDLIEDGFLSVRQTLIEIKSLLITPFKPFNSYINGSQTQLNDSFNSNNLNSIQTNPDSNLFLFIANHPNRDIDQQMANKSVNNCDINSCVNLSDEDLPEMITRLLGIVYAILIETSNTDDDSFNLFNSAVDKCVAHDAFNSSQKLHLNSWKQNINKILASKSLYRRSADGRLSRSKWGHTSVCNTLSNNNSKRVETKTYNSSSSSTAGSVVIRKQFSSISSNVSLSSQKSLPGIHEPILNNSFEPNFGNLLSPNLQNQSRPRLQLCRTHSAPVGRNHSSQTENHFHSSTYECDQLNDIEKLCIRMTEQALGLSDGGLLHQNIHHDL